MTDIHNAAEPPEAARRLFAAILVRDWEAVTETLAPDAIWEFDGIAPFAGEHRGRRAAVQALRQLLEDTRSRFRRVLPDRWEVRVKDMHVMLVDWYGSTREGRYLQGQLAFVATVADGSVTRLSTYVHEERAFGRAAR